MRIWHQSFTVLSDLGAYENRLARHFERVARPGTTVVLHGMKPGTYRTDYPGGDIRHVGFQYLHALQLIEAGYQAQKEGYDVYSISTLPDPALHVCRSMLDIPVVGHGESAMLTACLLGRRFSVLMFISDMAHQIEENAKLYGLSERLCSVADVGFRFHDVLAASDNPEGLIDKFRSSARKQIDRGADVLIPGEAPLCVLLAEADVSDVDGVPVLDPLSCWVKHAETLVDLKKQSGITRSRRGYFHEPPAQDRLDEVLKFYRLSN